MYRFESVLPTPTYIYPSFMEHGVDEKGQALENLAILADICQSALTTFASFYQSFSNNINTGTPAIDILRNDLLSLNQFVHTAVTRLSVSLGKPPPSYALALIPLKDLTSYVGQLASCTSSFPSGALRKEAVWASEEVVQALVTLVRYFESEIRHSRRGDRVGDGYLAMTGAVQDAVEKASGLSRDEKEAVSKAWRMNGEGLEDSLREVKEMMEESEVKDDGDGDGDEAALEDDGWDALGEGFAAKLQPEEIERVKKIYPLLRFTTVLHEKILSHHISKAPPLRPHSGSHLTRLLGLSNTLLPAADDLASALYAPQDSESIQEAARAVHQITKDFEQEMAATSEEATCETLEGMHLNKSQPADPDGVTTQVKDTSRIQKWFKQCFSQIDTIYNSLNFDA